MREANALTTPRPVGPHELPPLALVHDYLLVMRGAERTFAAIAACWPEASIYTLLYDPRGTEGRFSGRSVHSSYLQHLGIGQRGFRGLLPLFPRAAERLALQGHAGEDAVHVSYCHSPFRYAWHERRRGLDDTPRPLRPLVASVLDRTRRWDVAASRRVTHYIANSELTRLRIQDFWGREATVVHPPVATERFSIGSAEDFFLVVTELVRHKRVEHALEAARRARVRIKVVGDGPDLKRLHALYGSTAEFVGRISDEQLADLYPRARALVVPNIEEFGIAAVEAQAAGRPVIAVDAGGARETVIDGVTGMLVPPEDVDALADLLAGTDLDRLSPIAIRAHAAQFSTGTFQQKLVAEVHRLVSGSGTTELKGLSR